MERSEFSKSASSLNVFAPTSQLAAARTEINERARIKSTSQETGQTIGPDAANSNSPKRDPGKTGNSGTDLPFIMSITGSRIGSVDQESADQESAEQESLLAGAISALPSWMVSLIVHLALILILAVSSLGIGVGNRQLDLEFAVAPAQFETILTEIDFEDVVIEDEQESLTPDQTESLEVEEVVIPLEMMEVFTAESESDNSAQLGPLSGLPGSATTGTGKKGKSAKFFGTTSYGSRFVFVIDCSLSMKGNRWYRAVKELNEAIAELEKEQEFLVLLYNERSRVMMNVKMDLAALLRATDENKEACRSWLRKRRPNGGTFPASAMFVALTLEPDAVFLLSDGELQDNTRELLQFWNAEQNRSDGTTSRIPIHTISLGGQVEGQAMMKSIAKENDGDFSWIR